ncbi:MAG: type IX secretion system membrane protein PorP/SprF [Bacteroidales bacterium]|nr:type IX secretion system membrane protein PorP/SprF [Bacteroidales bacterium]
MMRKTTIISVLLLSCVLKVSANQNPLYTQFMTNPFLINPAIAGTYPYYQIITNSRLQWVGLTDAPMTNVISMFGPTVNQPMGFGGYIMHDVTGLTSQTTFSGTYAYNYAIAEDLKISMGLAIGISQYKIDGSGTTEVTDPIYTGETFQQFTFPATLGVYLYSSMYHVGISVNELLGSKLRIGVDTAITDLSRLKQHFYLHGGYKYMISREFSIEPTIIFRKVIAVPLQVDINVRAWYGKRQWERNRIWGGVSYRSQDAVTIMVGFTYQRKIEIGYSYDIGINKLRTYHFGSHELMIGFKFNDIKEY